MGECFTLRLLPVFFVQAGLDNLAIIQSAEQQLLFQNQSPGSSVEPSIRASHLEIFTKNNLKGNPNRDACEYDRNRKETVGDSR